MVKSFVFKWQILRVCLSTDYMGFCELDDYKEYPIFDYKTMAKEVKQLLSRYYSEEDTNKIMFGNAINHLSKTNENTLQR